jgi:two-component system response regulator RegX3
MRILVIGSADPILYALESALRKRGHQVTRTATCDLALKLAPSSEFVIIDLGLQDGDGYEMCSKLHGYSTIPIVMLTESTDEVDRVVALRLGADDCLSKPFSTREAIARIEVIARRCRSALNDDHSPFRYVRVGGLAIDVRARTVELDGAPVHFTRKEFELLTMLAENAGMVCTRSHILERVWDEHWYGPTRTLDVHIGSLRRKLGSTCRIDTVHGVGFRMTDPGG